MEWLHGELDALENLSYERLTELRAKNDKLAMLERHIDNLTHENEEVQKKIVQREFNLLEQDSIILSYEKNLRTKEALLKQRTERLDQVRLKAEELNQEISDKLRTLVDIETEMNRIALMQEDLRNQTLSADKAISLKKETLEGVQAEL